MHTMTYHQTEPRWRRLSDICYDLERLDHPLHFGFMFRSDRENAIANAVRTGAVPVRGRRSNYLPYPNLGSAFERIETRMSPDADVKVSFDCVTVSDPVGLPRLSATLAPLTIQSFVDVETNQTALECWLRENAMPLGWNEELAERKDGQTKKRQHPKRDPAKGILRKMYPNGLPSKENLPDHELLKKCKGPEWKDKEISPDTIKRAAEELREEQQTASRRIVK
jgi:hypothetical protein